MIYTVLGLLVCFIHTYLYYIHVCMYVGECIYIFTRYRALSNKANKIDTPGLFYIIFCGVQENSAFFPKNVFK